MAAAMSRLAAALTASRVATLDLASNEIKDEGAWELAWRLPECPQLERLLLAVNEIEDDGAAELLGGMLASPRLALDLRGNRIATASPTAAALSALGGRANLSFQRQTHT